MLLIGVVDNTMVSRQPRLPGVSTPLSLQLKEHGIARKCVLTTNAVESARFQTTVQLGKNVYRFPLVYKNDLI